MIKPYLNYDYMGWKGVLGIFVTGVIIGAVMAIQFKCNADAMDSFQQVKYIKGATITDTVEIQKPYFVEIPPKQVIPTKTIFVPVLGGDTIIKKVIDTVLILDVMNKFNTKLTYKHKLFDNDTIGTMHVFTSIQYNDLQVQWYEFTPVYKEVTQRKADKYELSLGYKHAINSYISAFDIDFFIRGWGGSIQYQTNFNGNNHTLAGVKRRFRF